MTPLWSCSISFTYFIFDKILDKPSHLLCVDHAVLELERLHEVRVPDHAAVGQLDVLHVLPQAIHLLDT